MFVFMPWDPVRDLLTMQERLESLFGRATPGWVPAVDLTEVDDRYLLSVELPGLCREDVTIEVHEGLVTLRGRRPVQSCCPERYQQLERAQGQFSRSFRFAVPIAPDRISAELTDGVLVVSIPKAVADSRRIEVA
jgi:HSP20 family protein